MLSAFRQRGVRADRFVSSLCVGVAACLRWFHMECALAGEWGMQDHDKMDGMQCDLCSPPVSALLPTPQSQKGKHVHQARATTSWPPNSTFSGTQRHGLSAHEHA